MFHGNGVSENAKYSLSPKRFGSFFEPKSSKHYLGFTKVWDRLKPKTTLGRRVKASAYPYLPGMEQQLNYEFNRLENIINLWAKHPRLFDDIQNSLKSLRDPLQSITLLQKGKSLSAVELFVLSRLCFCANTIRNAQKLACLSRWPKNVVLPKVDALNALLGPGSQKQPYFHISDEYSSSLASVRKRLRQKQGEYMKTVQNSDETIKELECEINELKIKLNREQQKVLWELSLKIRKHVGVIEDAARALGELDFLICKARFAISIKGVRPQIICPDKDHQTYLEVSNGYHVVTFDEIKARGGKYHPISIKINSTVSVITGPNMGGKTVTLATVGLCVAMAQWGLLVPCKHMKFALYDFIYFKPYEHQTPGLSSFASEIVSLKNLAMRIKQKGLVLLDEVGRGTNPSQGLALYAAFLQYYIENDTVGSTVLSVTHYHGLAKLLGVPHWQVKGLSSDFANQTHLDVTIVGHVDHIYKYMDYTLQQVGPNTSTPQDALVIAGALGLNQSIVEKAKKFCTQS